MDRLGTVGYIADREVVHSVAANTLVDHAVWVTVVLSCSIVDIAQLLLDYSKILVVSIEGYGEAGAQEAIRLG